MPHSTTTPFTFFLVWETYQHTWCSVAAGLRTHRYDVIDPEHHRVFFIDIPFNVTASYNKSLLGVDPPGTHEVTPYC